MSNEQEKIALRKKAKALQENIAAYTAANEALKTKTQALRQESTELRRHTAAIKANIEVTRQKTAAIEEKTVAIEEKIAAIEAETEELQQNNLAIQTNIERLRRKTVQVRREVEDSLPEAVAAWLNSQDTEALVALREMGIDSPETTVEIDGIPYVYPRICLSWELERRKSQSAEKI